MALSNSYLDFLVTIIQNMVLCNLCLNFLAQIIQNVALSNLYLYFWAQMIKNIVLSDVDLFPHVNELLLVRPSLLLQICSTNILQISACHALTKFCGTTYSNDYFELFTLLCQLRQDLLYASIEIQPTFECSDNSQRTLRDCTARIKHTQIHNQM